MEGWKNSNIWKQTYRIKIPFRKKLKQTEVRECLLLLSAETFVFQFAIQKLKIKIYRTIILPAVLYGCETWLLTLREEHRLKVLENRALRRIFVPKKDEVIKEWRKLQNEEFNALYASPNIVRVINLRRMR